MPKSLVKKEETGHREAPPVPVGHPPEPRVVDAQPPNLTPYAKLYEDCVQRYGDEKCSIIKEMYADAIAELVRRVVAEELRKHGVEFHGKICVEL